MAKRWIILMLTAVLCLTGINAAFAEVADGTYTVSTTGMHDGLEISVTFDGGKISDVAILSSNETPGVSDPAIERMPAEIVESNSVLVEVVSGATMTSNGIINGVKMAIEAAGGQVSDFENQIEAKTAVREEKEMKADVVIAGAGIAGLTASITAAEKGASVILLEKMSRVGGSMAISGGNFMSVESAVAAQYGAKDSLEDTLTFWQWSADQSINQENGMPDMDRVKFMLGHVDGILSWMQAHGVPFKSASDVNENTVAKIRTEGGGAAVAKTLEQAALNAGVTLLYETPATEIIVKDGKVVGLKAQSSTENLTIYAEKGVILATGGFGDNAEMMKELVPGYANAIPYVAKGLEGDGIRMATAIGAAVYEDAWVMSGGLSPAPSVTDAMTDSSMFDYKTLSDRVLINDEGKRFTNEYVGGAYAVLSNAAANEMSDVYYILDSSNEAFNASLEEAAAAGAIAKADTIEELAKAIGVNAEQLAETVRTYNAYCEEKNDPEFGKPADYLVGYSEEGPYYAMYAISSYLGTMYGVVTDYNGRVMDVNNEVIEHLYAVGEMSNRTYYNQVYVGAASLSLYPIAAQLAVEDMLAQ